MAKSKKKSIIVPTAFWAKNIYFSNCKKEIVQIMRNGRDITHLCNFFETENDAKIAALSGLAERKENEPYLVSRAEKFAPVFLRATNRNQIIHIQHLKKVAA